MYVWLKGRRLVISLIKSVYDTSDFDQQAARHKRVARPGRELLGVCVLPDVSVGTNTLVPILVPRWPQTQLAAMQEVCGPVDSTETAAHDRSNLKPQLRDRSKSQV